jgi:serine/threonine protein kinase
MRTLSDNALARLRLAAELPDLSQTRYRLVDKLGQGGMGSVYRVEDAALGRQVALKVIDIADADGQFADRLLHEARIIAQLEHPGIVPVHDVGVLADGRAFYTMKLVQGKRLDQHVTELKALPERLRLFQKLCETVAFAHAHGVLHRDLKPQNVMVGPFGEVLVMDWGLSKFLHPPATPTEDTGRPVESIPSASASAASSTAHGTVLGTPGYMAPEQAQGDRDQISERSDVFSLGALLRFLIEGSGNAGVSRRKALLAIVSKAMAAAPDERYRSAQELMLDVAHYVDGLPVSAYPEGVLGRLWRWTARNRIWIVLILSYLVMRALLIFWRTR